jgi:PPM family protein phosphatase
VILFRLEEVGGEAATDEPTVVGMAPVTVPAEKTNAPEDQPASAPSAILTAPAPRARAHAQPGTTTKTARLARTQGRPADSRSRPRRLGRVGKTLAALAAIVIVLFLVGGGGYLATRQLFFIGTNSQGIVTIFRGLPYDLPFGIRLYETFYVSGVPAQFVPRARRSDLFNHQIRSQNNAISVVHAAELGQLQP